MDERAGLDRSMLAQVPDMLSKTDAVTQVAGRRSGGTLLEPFHSRSVAFLAAQNSNVER